MSIESEIRSAVAEEVRRALADWVPPKTSVPAERPIRLLNVDQAAKVLGISAASVRRLIEAGKLPAVRAFSSIRLDVRDLEMWIESAKAGGGR